MGTAWTWRCTLILHGEGGIRRIDGRLQSPRVRGAGWRPALSKYWGNRSDKGRLSTWHSVGAHSNGRQSSVRGLRKQSISCSQASWGLAIKDLSSRKDLELKSCSFSRCCGAVQTVERAGSWGGGWCQPGRYPACLSAHGQMFHRKG